MAIELKEDLVERTHTQRQIGKLEEEVCREDRGASNRIIELRTVEPYTYTGGC